MNRPGEANFSYLIKMISECDGEIMSRNWQVKFVTHNVNPIGSLIANQYFYNIAFL